MTQTYETRRYQLAEEMAKSSCGALYGPDVIDQYLSLAEISLRHMAEEAKKAYARGWVRGIADDTQDYNTYLLTTGLIPDKNDEK